MTPRLLIYSRTTDYRHDSIPAAVAAVRGLGDFAVDATEDPAAFERSLEPYAAVVFLSTTGDVLTPAGRDRLSAYVDGGGGFAGVHAATCAEYGWPYFGDLIGARFARHPEFQSGRVVVEDADHPATRPLPKVWEVVDEWYDFLGNPRDADGVRVLARVDESSYEGGGMGDDHPLVWCRTQGEGAGRVFYTALGHASEAYQNPYFLAHLRGGLRWAAGLE